MGDRSTAEELGIAIPRLYLDSCIVIYLHEADTELQKTIRERLLPTAKPRPALYFSDLTRLECRVRPLREADETLLADYNRFFTLPGLSKISISAEVFDLAAELRAQYGFRTPDALHLSVAIKGNCDRFLTNDHRLSKAQLSVLIEVIPPQ